MVARELGRRIRVCLDHGGQKDDNPVVTTSVVVDRSCALGPCNTQGTSVDNWFASYYALIVLRAA